MTSSMILLDSFKAAGIGTGSLKAAAGMLDSSEVVVIALYKQAVFGVQF
jgi:hypothetical protein